MKRLEEYLSNCTSDFSDGTNGEPSAPGRAVGDTGTTVGVPDYKYNERLKKRHEKLRALMQRRDPDGVSKVPWDAQMRSQAESIQEQRLSPEEMAILRRTTKRRRRPILREMDDDSDFKDLEPNVVLQKGHGMADYYHVDLDGRFLGSIYKDVPNTKTSSTTLRTLSIEFPWVTMPAHSDRAGRHRTKEEAAQYLRDRFDDKKREAYSSEYWDRFNELKRQGDVQEDIDAIIQAVLTDALDVDS